MRNCLQHAFLALVVSLLFLPARATAGAGAEAGDFERARQFLKSGESAARLGNWITARERFHEATRLAPNSAAAFYDLGLALCHCSDLRSAAEAERKAIELDPGFIQAYVQLAWILTKLGDFEGAEQAARQALEIDADNAAAKRNLQGVLSARQAFERRQEGMLPSPSPAQARLSFGAESVTDKAGESRSAATLQDAGAGEPAAEWNTSAVKAAETAATPQTESGRLLAAGREAFQRGDLVEARQAFEAALNAEPGSSPASMALGVVLGSLGDIDAQIRHQRRAVELDPRNALAHVNLGWGYSRKGDWQRALGAYQEAAAIEPGCIEATVGQATALFHLGKAEAALALLKTTLNSCQPAEETTARLTLASLLKDIGRLDEALDEVDRTLVSGKASGKAKVVKASVLLELGRTEQAARLFEEALSEEPRSVDASLGMGLALLKSERFEEATAQLARTVEMDPLNATAHAALGLGLELQGQAADAERQMRLALDLDPRNSIAREALSRLAE